MANQNSDNQQFNYEPEAHRNIAALHHIYKYHRTRAARIQPRAYSKFVSRIELKDIEQRLLSFDLHLDIGLGDYAPSIIFTTLRPVISLLFAGVRLIS